MLGREMGSSLGMLAFDGGSLDAYSAEALDAYPHCVDADTIDVNWKAGDETLLEELAPTSRRKGNAVTPRATSSDESVCAEGGAVNIPHTSEGRGAGGSTLDVVVPEPGQVKLASATDLLVGDAPAGFVEWEGLGF